MKKLALALLAAACAVLPARADIICVAPTSTTAGSLQITAPINFTVNTTSAIYGFALDEWVTSDGTGNYSFLTPNLAFTINGTLQGSGTRLQDNAVATNFNSLTPNDGSFLLTSQPAVTAGSTVTLLAGTYALAATNDFNPLATQRFTGNMFVLGNTINDISGLTAVPEPSTWVMLGLGAAGAGVLAWRRVAASLYVQLR